jgi:hypothetical protein
MELYANGGSDRYVDSPLLTLAYDEAASVDSWSPALDFE